MNHKRLKNTALGPQPRGHCFFGKKNIHETNYKKFLARNLSETLNFFKNPNSGYAAAIRCTVSQMIEYPDSPEFHQKLIENEANIFIEEFFIAETNVLDMSTEVSLDEELENENVTLSELQIQ